MLVVICALGALGLYYYQLINDIGERDTDSESTVHYLNFNWPVTDCDSYIKQQIIERISQFTQWAVYIEEALLKQLIHARKLCLLYKEKWNTVDHYCQITAELKWNQPTCVFAQSRWKLIGSAT